MLNVRKSVFTSTRLQLEKSQCIALNHDRSAVKTTTTHGILCPLRIFKYCNLQSNLALSAKLKGPIIVVPINIVIGFSSKNLANKYYGRTCCSIPKYF